MKRKIHLAFAMICMAISIALFLHYRGYEPKIFHENDAIKPMKFVMRNATIGLSSVSMSELCNKYENLVFIQVCQMNNECSINSIEYKLALAMESLANQNPQIAVVFLAPEKYKNLLKTQEILDVNPNIYALYGYSMTAFQSWVHNANLNGNVKVIKKMPEDFYGIKYMVSLLKLANAQKYQDKHYQTGDHKKINASYYIYLIEDQMHFTQNQYNELAQLITSTLSE